ncbi:sulfatase-like hydrolase/transferase [Formosa sp. 3Alg 14/1]|uniref:sulfatase-like hydrolase/transferase n=1 Tax=Formosa sp. 3Alg 14/1 TaxID=3382190 RepID=UPI0039BE3453
MALLTGKYQQRTGIEPVITAKSHRDVGLNLDEITIAEEFKKYNYTCGMFGKWHLGYGKEFNPTLQGFDYFKGFVSGNVDYHAHIDAEGYLDWWNGNNTENEAGYTTDLITNYGVDFIKKHSTKPFLLYLPHEAPHGPYQRRIANALRKIGTPGTARVPGDSIKAIYKEMVEVMDQGIGKIMDALKTEGIYENTIVIFTSDNGANNYGDNGVLRGIKGSPYEGGSRVPAIISYPNVIKAGTTSEQTVFTMDLLPTLLDIIGEQPCGKHIDGISIKNHLINQTDLPKRDVFYAFRNQSYIRSGEWKIVKTINEKEAKFELYNLSHDIEEKNNVALNNPELLETLQRKLTVWEQNVRVGVKTITK